MSLSDLSKKRNKITRVTTNSIYGKLLQETINRIHDLSLFHYVGALIRTQQAIHCPACIVIPKGIETAETHLTGGFFDYRYAFDIAFALKHPNDSVMVQEALGLAEKVREIFSCGDSGVNILIYGGVSGHYNTEVEFTNIEPVQVLSEGVLAFSSGLNIVYSVQTAIANP